MANCFSQLRMYRGQDAVLTLRRYEKTLLKISSLKNRLEFLNNCRENHVMPKSFQEVKNADGTYFGDIQRKLLENAITLHNREKNQAFLENRTSFRNIEEIGFDRYVGEVMVHIRNKVRIIGNRQRVNLDYKLENLFRASHWVKFSNIENVKNLSRRLLSRDEMVLLGLGLNFCIGEGNNFFTDFNSKINFLNSEKHNGITEFLRGVAISDKSEHPVVLPSNLKLAMIRLNKYKDIKIMKSDKGNSVVIMNVEDYTEKMNILVSDPNTYKSINHNVDMSDWQSNFNSSLNRIIANIDEEIFNDTRSPKLPTMPYLYGLPKIHKPNIPMRPIVASLRSPSHNLAKWLTKILSPCVGVVSEAHLKHSTDFLDSLGNVNEPFDDMVSFDVVSLFTNIPLEKVLDFITTKGEEGLNSFQIPVGKICELIKLCVRDSYFSFDNKIYQQTFGVAMGSSLSPILANLYMEFYEVSLLPRINVTGVKIVLWKRYVDDIFALLKLDDVDSLNTFLLALNSKEPSIKFTLEKSQNNTLPFLDVSIENMQDNFKTKVYRKSTHTNSYIHFFSHHSTEIKRDVITGLFLRAYRICVPLCLDDELHHIRSSFEELAYPNWFIDSAHKKARKIYYSHDVSKHWNEEGKKVIKLPYRKALKEVTENLTDDHKFVFHFNNTIRKSLCKNKLNNQYEEEKPGVYVINCQDCNLSYVGETGRHLSKRKNEHKTAVRNFDQKSAIAKHCWNLDHRMNFKDSKIVYANSNIIQRRAVEGVLINSIPTIPGNKSFNSIDKLNSREIIRECKLTNFVKDANNPDSFGEPNPPTPGATNPDQRVNPPDPPDIQPLGRIEINNGLGQIVRRSMRNL